MGVSYHHLTIGPKAYTARGTSGWVETFRRKQADEALARLLGDKPLAVIVEGFRAQRKKIKGAIDWSAILDYLCFILDVDEKTIPDEAGVAFWCQVILATEAERQAKLN